jgi:hypothetical protein
VQEGNTKTINSGESNLLNVISPFISQTSRR